MKKLGSELAVHALEQIGVKFTFGIPGVHTTELYDALNKSTQIKPVLVTHEGAGSFMADGVSRTSDSIGTLCIVPAAGTTHAMSGIGEAYLDGTPMLIISGGTRRDSWRHYQLHQMDLEPIVSSITKGYFLIEGHEDIIPTIYKAYDLATQGEPGPVFVEIPVELQLFQGEVSGLGTYTAPESKSTFTSESIKQAVDMLTAAERPGLYIGWGAVECYELTRQIAERLVAPVSTTLQGLSSFLSNHPLHTGVGFGSASVPASQEAFKGCDAMLAVGVRFSELGTGSYGVTVPENLIHVDINPEVFDKSYPTKVRIEGDAKVVLQALLAELESRSWTAARGMDEVGAKIQADKQKYYKEWLGKKSTEKVSPGHFFRSMREQLPDNVQMVVDDGKHTFLAAELFPVHKPGGFVSPTDFNCMGFCVPAAIGAKLANPDTQVAAIVGDGAFMMTCMELLTASTHGLGVMVFVFHDGELGQISQFQQVPLNRKTCTIIGDLKVEGVAIATGAHFISMQNDGEIESGIAEAIKVSQEGKPVIVDVNIDYSKKTNLTKGVIKTNLARFPFKEKVRFIARAAKRHVLG